MFKGVSIPLKMVLPSVVRRVTVTEIGPNNLLIFQAFVGMFTISDKV